MAEEKALKDDDQKAEGPKIAPFPHEDAFDRSTIGDVDKLVSLGFKAIAEGQCAVIILAGGQGTRLGFNRPKGCFNVGFPSQKTIYQLQIEKVLAVKRAAARAHNAQSVRFPIYLMTSTATHEATQQFLDSNGCFGYNPAEVKLFEQQQHPCLREQEGALIMKSASEIAMSPNGNGGIYSSLKMSGVLDEMKQFGIEYVQVFGIDNVLARVGDPLWFGHMVQSEAEISNKTCIKQDPHEKIGIMCLKEGKPAVTEYTELTTEMVELRQQGAADGALEYCYGNLAMHEFTVSFIARICGDDEQYALPIHVARKKIPFYDGKRKRTVTPDSSNGIKLEFFVFDTFQFSEKCTVFNIEREEEFAPVKNAKGKDSPMTARTAHSNYWKKEVVRNGGQFEDDGAEKEELVCEVSPLFGYLPYGDDLFKQRVEGKTFSLPRHLKCE